MLAQARQTIRRSSVVDEIAAQLQREILEGTYSPGDALPPERELAERYGVTRTSLKHALVRLEQLGLIRTRHGVGSIVQDVQESGGADLMRHMVSPGKGPDIPFLREILEARTYVVAAYSQIAAERRTDEEIEELRDLLDELDENPDDPRQALRIEGEFFRMLARASRNRAFVFLTNSVTAAAKLDTRKFAEPLRDREWVKRSLAGICDAVVARDREGARVGAEEYFRESSRRMFASLSARRGSNKEEGE